MSVTGRRAVRAIHPSREYQGERNPVSDTTASATPSAAEPGTVVVAVDGPAGSGKSSVSRAVARRLGLGYLDTGAMYRAVTWACLDAGVDLDDPAAVLATVRAADVVVGTDPDDVRVTVNGHDVTAEIRTGRVSGAVSSVARNLDVRAELIRLQREAIAAERSGPRRGVIAEGRDITTVVAPDADVRLLLTASEEARARRRAHQLAAAGRPVDAATVAATRARVAARDATDSTVNDFTNAAEGVTTLDTSDLDFDGTLAAVLDLVARTTGRRAPVQGARS